MFRLSSISIALGVIVLLSACATQQFDIASSNGAEPSFTENQTFWVGGVGQEVQVDGAQACGDAKFKSLAYPDERTLMKRTLYSLALCLTLCACATQSVVLKNGSSSLTQEEMQSFFVQGLGQTQTLNAAEVCGGANRVAKVERVLSPLNWFLGVLSSGIYTPITAKVYCS